MPGKYDFMIQYTGTVDPHAPRITVAEAEDDGFMSSYDPSAPAREIRHKYLHFTRDLVRLRKGEGVPMHEFVAILGRLQEWLWTVEWSKRAEAEVKNVDPFVIDIWLWVENKDHIQEFLKECEREFDELEKRLKKK